MPTRSVRRASGLVVVAKRLSILRQRWLYPSPLLASDLAKDLRKSSIKSHLWCQFTARWHSPSRASHVDFETRYNRTRVMTSWAFAAARFSVGDFLL